jgi:hypothetical protein
MFLKPFEKLFCYQVFLRFIIDLLLLFNLNFECIESDDALVISQNTKEKSKIVAYLFFNLLFSSTSSCTSKI